LRSRNNRGADGNLYLGISSPAFSRPNLDQPPSAAHTPAGYNLGESEGKISANARIRRALSRDQLIRERTAQASPKSQSVIRNRIPVSRLIVRFALRAMRASKLRRPDFNRVSKRIASFLCGRHFLRAFSSRDDAARDASATAVRLSYARQNNVVRNLSQRFLIAVGIEARA
jgi:hypothetical protein